MKPGDLVSYLHWKEEAYRVAMWDPHWETRVGILLEIGVDYAGHELKILTETGEIRDVHESFHKVKIIHEPR